jgi:hypothetical protein
LVPKVGKRTESPWDFLGVVKLWMPASYTSLVEGAGEHEVIIKKKLLNDSTSLRDEVP